MLEYEECIFGNWLEVLITNAALRRCGRPMVRVPAFCFRNGCFPVLAHGRSRSRAWAGEIRLWWAACAVSLPSGLRGQFADLHVPGLPPMSGGDGHPKRRSPRCGEPCDLCEDEPRGPCWSYRRHGHPAEGWLPSHVRLCSEQVLESGPAPGGIALIPGGGPDSAVGLPADSRVLVDRVQLVRLAQEQTILRGHTTIHEREGWVTMLRFNAPSLGRKAGWMGGTAIGTRGTSTCARPAGRDRWGDSKVEAHLGPMTKTPVRSPSGRDGGNPGKAKRTKTPGCKTAAR